MDTKPIHKLYFGNEELQKTVGKGNNQKSSNWWFTMIESKNSTTSNKSKTSNKFIMVIYQQIHKKDRNKKDPSQTMNAVNFWRFSTKVIV